MQREPPRFVLIVAAYAVSCETQQDRVCAEMGMAHVQMAKTEWGRDYSNRDTETFYSPVVDSCVHLEVATIGVDFEVRDLSHTILRDGGNQNILLFPKGPPCFGCGRSFFLYAFWKWIGVLAKC